MLYDHGMDRLNRPQPYRAARPVRRSVTTRHNHAHLRRVLRVLAVMGVVAIIGVLLTPFLVGAAVVNAMHQDQTAKADAIVVLGAAQFDGQPSPDLKARLDHAADLYQAGDASLIVLTGGSEPGDRYTEAEAGEMYLHGRGIPTGAMVKVGGNTTIESLREASALLESKQKTRALMVSDPFHMYRVVHMADDLGLQPLSSPTRTSPITPGSDAEKKAIVREVFAYLAYLFLQR